MAQGPACHGDREGYESLAPLFPPGLEWKVARLNPFKQRPSECRTDLAALFGELEALKPDLILAPTLNRTWLEIAVAAHFKGARSIVLGGAEVDPIFAASLRLDLGVDPAKAFTELVPVDKAETDVENQHRFAERVIGTVLPRAFPSVAPAKEAVSARLRPWSPTWSSPRASGRPCLPGASQTFRSRHGPPSGLRS